MKQVFAATLLVNVCFWPECNECARVGLMSRDASGIMAGCLTLSSDGSSPDGMAGRYQRFVTSLLPDCEKIMKTAKIGLQMRIR
jgi:hypothetical protein